MKRTRLSVPGTRIPPKMYSQAIVCNNIVYVSGQLGRHPEDGHLDVGDAEAQIRQSFENVRMILEYAGSSLDKIITCECHLQNVEDLPILNKVYAELFEDMEIPPSRCAIGSNLVVPDCLFEVVVSGIIDED